MKRILIITPFAPGKEEGGGAAYTYELIEALSNNNIVDLLYFRYSDKAKYIPNNENVKVIDDYLVNRITKIIGALSLPFLFPLFTARFRWSVAMKLNKIAENYDYIYLDFSQTFSYARYIKHPHIIMMSHDVIAQKYSRMKRILFGWAKWSEGFLLKQGCNIFTFSDKDCSIINSLYGIQSQSTSFFISNIVKDSFPSEVDNYYVMFGSWGRTENYETLQWVMDNINTLLKNNEKIIVIGGGSLPDAVKQRMEETEGMEYRGFIDNPYPIIANAKAEIVPLRKGAGVKVKCVEALACGTPVIGTEVAFEGIPEKYKDFMIFANTPEEYRKAMDSINFSIEERVAFKRFFIDDYNYKNILKFIDA